ncbi:MAG: hypothetical protein BYD32DRAFT_460733 [Podila humilis]|nr:MAG: hypothetical protein BYD32DRAFT_460733 [Podila humilis]
MTFSDWPSQKQRSSSAQASATTPGHLSTPPRSPESPSSNALFSLPRIPYFFTITPFPLNPVVTAALPCSSRRMKRRFESNEPNKLNHAPSSFPPAHEKDMLQQHQQQQPPASSPDSEYGGLGIDGRVLKKMRGIKLDSESPPYHSPEDSPEESLEESFARGQELATEPSMSTFRGFGTMKISTKSASSIVTPNGTQHHPTSEIPQVYSGMNHLLHQVHSSRFGIPDGTDTTDTRVQEHEAQANAMFHEQQHQLQQQRHHQPRQHERVNFNGPTSHEFQAPAVWHLARLSREEPPSTGASMDLDEDMADANDATQGTSFISMPSQGYVLSQHNHYSDTSQPHEEQQQQQRQQQRQQQQHDGDANLYHNINAQLRSAFLARLEMESRSRQ